MCHRSRRGYLGGLRGRSPQNLRWGDGPRIGPPNILSSSVVGCARKYEQRGGKGVIKEFFSEIVAFLVKKVLAVSLYTTFNTVKIRKIRITWSMTIKRHQKFWA